MELYEIIVSISKKILRKSFILTGPQGTKSIRGPLRECNTSRSGARRERVVCGLGSQCSEHNKLFTFSHSFGRPFFNRRNIGWVRMEFFLSSRVSTSVYGVSKAVNKLF